jgi:lysophospholipase L1-like esterase
VSQFAVFLVGDSTMSFYDSSKAPRAGWGQVLEGLLSNRVKVHNRAASGRSSKSFIHEGRLEAIDRMIGPGDYLLIQFGHNDQHMDEKRHTEPYSTFQSYLQQYIDTARAHQAQPVLITPVQRRSFDEEGRFQESHGVYPDAIKQLAEANNVPLIDLAAKSRALLERVGAEHSKSLFLWLQPGEHENYSEGVQDDTHFSEYGAKEIAKLIIEGCKELEIPIV